jgi:hypothetical protein
LRLHVVAKEQKFGSTNDEITKTPHEWQSKIPTPGAALRYSLHTLTFKKIKGKKNFYIDILDQKKILNILK